MSDPFQVVRDFEAALCEYTDAPYAVTTSSCTMALLLAVAWHLRHRPRVSLAQAPQTIYVLEPTPIEIPKRTYVSVPMSIIHAGGRPTFRDEDWWGMYQLSPLPVWDSARWLTSRMWSYPSPDLEGQMICLSFHWTKTLGVGQAGAILHDDPEADRWLRRARFDGREEGTSPSKDAIQMVGWHCYMSPRDAAEGLTRLCTLPRHNDPLPNDDYPDLSQMEIFK